MTQNISSQQNKKNLLLMTPMLHQGGFERVCVQTARLLQEEFNTSILIFSDKDINYDISGLEVINIDVPSEKGTFRKVRNVLRRIRKVRQIKRERKTDIAYSFGSSANIINVLSKAGEKTLTGIRCSTDTENPREVGLLCSRSDQVLSCSKEIMRQLRDDYHYDRSVYIYNPLNTEDIIRKAKEEVSDFPFAEDAVVIAGMGRDDYIKGFWHLIKAFSIVEKEFPKARLMILGAGSFKGCRKLAADLGIEDKVAFPGVRKNPFPYISRADLYVLSSNHEGFPNALLEAMALGKPVVAADCKTGPREILLSDEAYEELLRKKPSGESVQEMTRGDFGLLVPDMDQTENYDANVITEKERILAQAILTMLRDPTLRTQYAEAAAGRSLTYTPQRYKDSLARILHTV